MSAQTWRRIFAVTYGAYVCAYFARKPFAVAKLEIERDLGLNHHDLSLIDTGFLTGYTCGQFLVGPLAAFMGTRELLALSFLGPAMCMAFFGLSSSHSILVLVWTVNGGFQGFTFPLFLRVLSPHFDAKSRGRALGIWNTSCYVGGMASTCFGAIVAHRFGWRSIFLGPFPIIAMAGFVILWQIPHSDPDSETGVSKDEGKAKKDGLAEMSRVARLPGMWNIGVGYFCMKLVRSVFLMWLPYVLNKQRGLDLQTAGICATIFDVGSVCGSLTCGYVMDMGLGSRRTATGAAFAAGIVLFLYGELSKVSIVVDIGMLFLIGAVVSGCDSILGGVAIADICEKAHDPKALTTASGLVNGMGSLGSILQGPLAAAIATYAGWDKLFSTLTFLAVTAVLVLGEWPLPCGLGAAQGGARKTHDAYDV